LIGSGSSFPVPRSQGEGTKATIKEKQEKQEEIKGQKEDGDNF